MRRTFLICCRINQEKVDQSAIIHNTIEIGQSSARHLINSTPRINRPDLRPIKWFAICHNSGGCYWVIILIAFMEELLGRSKHLLPIRRAMHQEWN